MKHCIYIVLRNSIIWRSFVLDQNEARLVSLLDDLKILKNGFKKLIYIRSASYFEITLIRFMYLQNIHFKIWVRIFNPDPNFSTLEGACKVFCTRILHAQLKYRLKRFQSYILTSIEKQKIENKHEKKNSI